MSIVPNQAAYTALKAQSGTAYDRLVHAFTEVYGPEHARCIVDSALACKEALIKGDSWQNRESTQTFLK